jgi:hypothetical protein
VRSLSESAGDDSGPTAPGTTTPPVATEPPVTETPTFDRVVSETGTEALP